MFQITAPYPKHRHHRTITKYGSHYLGGYRRVEDPSEEDELTPSSEGWVDDPTVFLEDEGSVAEPAKAPRARVNGKFVAKGPISTD